MLVHYTMRQMEWIRRIICGLVQEQNSLASIEWLPLLFLFLQLFDLTYLIWNWIIGQSGQTSRYKLGIRKNIICLGPSNYKSRYGSVYFPKLLYHLNLHLNFPFSWSVWEFSTLQAHNELILWIYLDSFGILDQIHHSHFLASRFWI